MNTSYPTAIRCLPSGSIGANFLRVTLASDGVGARAAGAMHFSLLLPRKGRAPVWPWLDDRGRTKWPEGADALPALTVAVPGTSRFVWVAAEKDVIRTARSHFRATAALTPAEGYFSWYWKRPA